MEGKEIKNNENNNKNSNVIIIILVSIIGALLLIVGALLLKDKINIPFISSDKKKTEEKNTNGNSNGNYKRGAESQNVAEQIPDGYYYDEKTNSLKKKETKTVKNADTRSAEELLEVYFTAQINGDFGRFLSVFSKDYRVYMSKYIKQTDLQERSKVLKERYGDDVKAIVEFNGTNKMDDNWIKENKDYLEKQIGKTLTVTECYSYNASVTLKGSKGEQKYLSSDVASDLAELWYCKINGDWGLVMG